VVSGADLFTLLSSAQDTQVEHTGVVIGTLLFNGQPVSDVALKLTDKEGKVLAIRMEGRKERDGNGAVLADGRLILPDGSDCPSGVSQVEVDRANGVYICTTIFPDGSLYYNSPGAIPDFSNNLGTAAAGGFSIFRVPPGEVYLWTARGARGNGRITVFADPDSVSVGTFQVLPIPIATVGVTGGVVEGDDPTVSVPEAAISVVGLREGIVTASDTSGVFTISRIGSNGSYLMRASKSGHTDTYSFLNTPLDQVVPPALQITKTALLYKTDFLQTRAANSGVPLDLAKGILAGRVTTPDGTPQQCAVLEVTDADGTSLSSLVDYTDPGSAFGCDGSVGSRRTGSTGEYFVYNLPPGPIFISHIAKLSGATPADPVIFSGGAVLNPLGGGVFVQDLLNSGNGAPFSLRGRVVSSADEITGVEGATVRVLGRSGSVTSDSAGNYEVPGLVAGQSYVIKVSCALPGCQGGYLDSYQTVGVESIGIQQNLLAVASPVPNPERGNILGTAIDTVTGKGAPDLIIQATDLSGNFLGSVATNSLGKFTLTNLPPGPVNLQVISQDDGGNGLVRVFSDGISLVNFIATKALPQRVNYSGSIRDLDQTAVDGVHLSVIGTTRQADASGIFSLDLESNGRFIVKATKDGYHDSYNDQVRTFLFNRTGDLFIPSRGVVSQILGRNPDPSRGIVGGAVVSNDFTSQDCGCGSGTKGVLAFFNQDTVLDLAVLDGNSVAIFLGDGNGGFTSPAATYGVGGGASDIVSADFNRDGFPDLAVANRSDNTLTILMGNQGGTFTPLTTNNVPYFLVDEDKVPDTAEQIASPVALAVGDFSGDQIPDLAVASQSDNAVYVLLGVGNGAFTRFDPGQNLIQPVAAGTSPTAIVAADLNLDARADLAVAADGGGGTVTVLLGGGNGTFQSLNDSPTGGGNPVVFNVGSSPSAITAGDFNGDGRPDLAAVGDAGLSILLGTTNSTQLLQPLQDSNGVPIRPSVGSSPLALTPLDVNQDGRIDLAVINSSGLAVLLGAGDGTFSNPNPIPATSGAASLLVGDLNRDGFFDLLLPGTPTRVLLGGEQALAGVSVEATDADGNLEGEVFYLDSGGTWRSSQVQGSTGPSGRFIIYNVNPGMTHIAAKGGGGNQMVTTHPDGYTHLSLRVINLAPFTIPVSGTVLDPVGPSPGGVGVGNVYIKVLGTPHATTSLADPDPQKQGSYSLNGLPANSEFVVKMCFTPPGGEPGCP
jgi:hypothetical protein